MLPICEFYETTYQNPRAWIDKTPQHMAVLAFKEFQLGIVRECTSRGKILRFEYGAQNVGEQLLLSQSKLTYLESLNTKDISLPLDHYSGKHHLLEIVLNNFTEPKEKKKRHKPIRIYGPHI